MEGRGLEVKEGEFALECRIAFHVKSALCCPLAPAPYPCSLRARQGAPVVRRGDARVAPPCPTTLCVWRSLPYLTLVRYLPGGGWSPLSGLVGVCVCGLWGGRVADFRLPAWLASWVRRSRPPRPPGPSGGTSGADAKSALTAANSSSRGTHWVALSRSRRGSAPRDLESACVCLYSPGRHVPGGKKELSAVRLPCPVSCKK